MLFRALFAFPFQIRQCNRSTSATITAFAAARSGSPVNQPVRHLFEMLKFHRDVKPVKNRRFQDARAGENTRSPGQPSVKAVSTVSLFPPTASRFFLISASMSVDGFRDAAENLTATSLRFDIANPHLEVTFVVLAAPDEGGIHGNRDRRHHRRRPDRGTVDERGAVP